MTDVQRAILRTEAQALGELAALHRDPVYYGRGVPRGDGRVVVVVPGLFGNDAYLRPLRTWLSRIGYSPARSTLSINAGCPDRLRTQVEQSLPRRLERQPGPICLIGHSRGGMLGWAIASRLQQQVSHLALLGSPAPAVVAMMVQGHTLSPSTVATSWGRRSDRRTQSTRRNDHMRDRWSSCVPQLSDRVSNTERDADRCGLDLVRSGSLEL